MKVTLNEIMVLVDDLSKKINAPHNLLPTYEHSINCGHPHIEIDKNGQCYYVIVERGEELKRDFPADTNDLLFRVFSDITFSMALQFELNNRIDKEDSRIQIFSKQQELLAILNNDWGIRIGKEHQSILRTNPFRSTNLQAL